MSFWPLATSLVEALRTAARGGPLIELGIGDGAFAARLSEIGVEVVGLDGSRSARARDLLADLRQLPFRPRCIAGFVAANTLRHLDRHSLRRFAAETAQCGRPGALLVVFEDDPLPLDAPSANYRECLRLLSDADPSRGSLLAYADCERELRELWPTRLGSGTQLNGEVVRDAQEPLRWLSSRLPAHGELRARLRRLQQEVDVNGMSYGNYWYALWRCD